jgi:exopolysaccharide biosynthesis polyprenyl glycosylphosphotransferase
MLVSATASYEKLGTDAIESLSRKIPGVAARMTAPKGSKLFAVATLGELAGARTARAVTGRAVLQSLRAVFVPETRAEASQSTSWGGMLSDFGVSALLFALLSHLCRVPDFSSSFLLRQFLTGEGEVEQGSAGFSLIFAALVILLAYAQGVYQGRRGAVRFVILSLLRAVAGATLLVWPSTQLLRKTNQMNGALAWTALATGVLLTLEHWAGARWLRKSAKATMRNVIIVGADEAARDVARAISAETAGGRIVKGFIADKPRAGFDILGGVEDLPRVARAEFVDEVILSGGEDARVARRVVRLARENRLDLRVVPTLFGFTPPKARLEYIGELPAIALLEEPLPSLGLKMKRGIDVLLSATALAMTSPLLAIIALVVKIDSPGPILYSAQRIGKKGRSLRCHKFRTMVGNADALKENLRTRNERAGPLFKIGDDPRITSVGRMLRRYSLDELPQLWNVLIGDMSLVGPRPHPLDDFARYHLNQFWRLDVSPGLTGLWQVEARRDPSFHQSLSLDLKYIENWSLWLDLKILFKTLPVVLAGTGV